MYRLIWNQTWFVVQTTIFLFYYFARYNWGTVLRYTTLKKYKIKFTDEDRVSKICRNVLKIFELPT